MASATVTANVGAGSGHYLMTFAMRIPSSCFTGDPDPITVFQQLESTYFAILMWANPDGTGAIVEKNISSQQAHPLTRPLFQFDKWQHVSINVSYATTPSPISVTLDEGSALFDSLALTNGPGGVTMTVGVEVLNEAGASPGCTVDIDDVTFDYK